MTQALDMDLELSDEEMHLYSRQILLDGWDIEAQEKLKLANVLIVGCGGIGCTTAELLARAGVGKITLIDADTIEMSNLQRQIAYVEDNIGFYKAEILAKRLKQINPHIRVESQTVKLDESNAEALISTQDLVLDGCDNFTTRYLVNQSCKQFNVPLISASAIGFQGQLFMVEDESACYECLFPKEQHANENLRCADSGVLATTPNVMASLQAHHALLYLGLGKTPLKQKLMLWDGLSMKQRLLAFEKDTDCPICQAR
ncbi:HesA/MoeB/ThiF family protein [Acinetobacter haemolyticus]|uniref:HesA/MoeB/ThiF family protein n=2 Tax=unclassified Acinetobacter TaxID=196816 RepID=UPI0015D16130|nr:HesA/MoeB/ThiF family protein [Acinetobacter sp.]MDD2945764.1 HesA/MoeB/ThiF family protein [Acinetobacter sp.]UDM39425.1 HesA/MoeB/ThiF family protein [Acinetobacter haemolyticus]